MKQLQRVAATAIALAALLSAGNVSAQWWNITGNALAGGEFLGTTNANFISFETVGTERARITSGGNIGINTTTPARILQVHATTVDPQFRIGENATDAWDFWGGREFHVSEIGTSLDWMFFSPAAYLNIFTLGPQGEVYADLGGGTSRFGIGVINPSSRLTVDGSIVPTGDCLYDIGSSSRKWDTIWACNGTINTSDATLKENIQDLAYGIKDVMKLRPVSYNWKRYPGGQRDLGLIAQEVQQVLGEVVKGNDGSGYGIFYSDIIPVLVKAMQDQQSDIRTRSSANQALREQVALRAERIARLESALANAGANIGEQSTPADSE